MNVSKLLRRYVKPSFGCTDPVAVGLATSIAYNAIRGKVPCWLGDVTEYRKRIPQGSIKEIIVSVDRNIYKNSLACGIPGTGGLYGIYVAVALGVFCNPDLELELFRDTSKEKLELAKKLLCEKKVKIELRSGKEADIDILAKVTTNTGYGLARIQHYHTNVTYIEANNRVLYRKEKGVALYVDKDLEELAKMKIEEIVSIIEKFSSEDRNFLLEGIEMNVKASEAGMKEKLGAGIGYTLYRMMREGKLTDNAVTLAKIRTAATVDARMSGCSISVMSSSGSGNQGLIATLPIFAVAEKFGKDKKKLSEAVGLSHLLTAYCTYYSGILTAFCGCGGKAGIGAAAGVAYYLTQDIKTVGDAINNMAANITGMICDGAKVGCAIKLSTAAGAIVESALLAVNGVKIPPTNGIIGETPEETIKNVGEISKGMIETDETILKIMQEKYQRLSLRNFFLGI
jgi:L-cysteine desulfidase